MADQVLERFHRALIEEIQTQRPEYLTQPFTVAEIYQNLVPYGSHRDRIGVEMNGDYEDALVRLLAGEGGYLILDSEPALKKLQTELDTPNPNTGIYREYAAADVRLNQAYLDLSAEALDELPDLVHELEAEDPVTLTDLAPSEGNASAGPGETAPGGDIFSDYGADAGADADVDGPGAMAAEAPAKRSTAGKVPTDATPADEDPEEAASEAEDQPEGAPASARPPLAPEYVEPPEPAPVASAGGGRPGAAEGACVWCRADLPERENVNYCPFCGTDLRLVPCSACGAEVEPGWVFCAACGTEVDG